MIRQMWTVLQWMKQSKSYQTWFSSIKEQYSRIRWLFGYHRRIRPSTRPKVRSFLPSMEMLEDRLVPTISIGGTTYSSLAAAVSAASSGQTINIDTTGMPVGGYVGGVTISTPLTIAGPTSGTLPTIASPSSASLSGSNGALIDVEGGADVTISSLIISGAAGFSNSSLLEGINVDDGSTLDLRSRAKINWSN